MNFGERDRRGVDRPQEIGVDRFAGMVDDELGGVAQICQKLDVGARCDGFEAARTAESPRYRVDSQLGRWTPCPRSAPPRQGLASSMIAFPIATDLLNGALHQLVQAPPLAGHS